MNHARNVCQMALVALVGAGCAGPFEAIDGIATTERGHDWANRLTEPLTQPYLFESPVIESNLRPIYIRHAFPSDGVFGGGRADIYALEVRIALSDRLAIIAPVDGYVDFEPDSVPDASGEADIAAGVKYAFIDDPEGGRIATAGLMYHGTSGDSDIFQGNGQGAWRPFMTVGVDCDRWNVLGSVGAYLPIDGDAESQYIDWHLHTSYEWSERLAPLVEINGIHYTNNGRAFPASFEAGDYGNLGSNDVEGNDYITGAIGFRYKITDTLNFGLGYEQPLTDREDITDERITMDLVWRF